MHLLLQGQELRNIDWSFEKGIKEQNSINVQGWTPNLYLSDKKVETKNWHGCFEIHCKFNVCDLSTLGKIM